MTRYALNSAVLTAFGSYEYEPLNRTAAREWWEAGPVEATIGYEETCIAMERVLGIPRARVNRKTIDRIARRPLPAGWPEDVRRPWSARRDLARMASVQPLDLDSSEI